MRMETECCLRWMFQLFNLPISEAAPRARVWGGRGRQPIYLGHSSAHVLRSWTGERFWSRVFAWEKDPLARLLRGGSLTRHKGLACSELLIHVLDPSSQTQARAVQKLCCCAAGVGGGRQWSGGCQINNCLNHSMFWWARKKKYQEQTKGSKTGKISKWQGSRTTLFVVSEIQIGSSV